MSIDRSTSTTRRNARSRIGLREKLVASVGALTLAYTAWGFGGVVAWSLHLMLAGGLLTLALAVVPWPGSQSGSKGAPRSSLIEGRQDRAPGEPGQMRGPSQGKPTQTAVKPPISRLPPPASNLRRLFGMPALYFAVAFLLYLAIAALNPAWQIVSDERGWWWLEPMAPPLATWLSWLPTSVASDYEPMNAWRIFNMHLAALSLALGLRAGLHSRRTALFVLWVTVISVSAMAAVAIAQKYNSADAVLWTLKSQNEYFWGSFFYRNQGAAYLNWGIVLCGTLYFLHSRRARDMARSGGPHFIAFLLIGLLATSIGLALSRGGILFAAILLAFFLLFVLFDYLLSSFRFPLAVFLPLSLVAALLLAAGIYQTNKAIDWEAMERRFGDIRATIENSEKDARVRSSKVTWEMAQYQLWTGWGAGSFRYVFPMYQKELKGLFYYRHDRKRGWIGRRFYRYAHNDLLQFIAEYGIIGSSLLLLTILCLLWPALTAGIPLLPATCYLLLGCACAAAHAFLDFIFHSPAFWVVFIAGIALASRLLRLEARRA